MHYLFFILFISLTAGAQHSEQPEKESTEDLRSATVLFVLEDVSKDETFQLERTPGLDHFLRFRSNDDETIRKTDSRIAHKLDMDFASRFLRCQYELPTSEGDCKIHYRLNMKGEKLEICSKDEKKSQEIKAFIKDLSKRF